MKLHLLLPALLLTPQALKSERPNVILIYADDLGYGDLECFGARNIHTPNVNRLASEGVRLTNVHAAASTSTPSRYSLLTGEYAWRHEGTGVANGDAAMIIRPDQFTLADMFKSAGYHTAAIGKWHLGLGSESGKQDWNAPLACGPGDIGFDYSYIMAATADRVPCVFIENGAVANYDETAPIEVNYNHNFPGEPDGANNPELLTKLRWSHGHNQAIVNDIGRIGYMKGGGRALWQDENIADSITLKAEQFIEKHSDEPFFMYFATNDVHVPRYPHDRFRGKNPMGLRGDAIAQFDWSVGRILDKLDELGIADNTLIILSSDNGPVVDDGYDDNAEQLLAGHEPSGGLRGAKYSAYEGGTMVPAIVRWPGKSGSGIESNALISQIDWLASLAAVTGARIPRDSAPDSFNHLSTLLGQDTDDRPWVVEHAYDNTLSIRTARHKYIEPSNGAPIVPWGTNIETGFSTQPQLFDLKTDPTERTNIAPGNPQLTEQLSTLLEKIRQRSADTSRHCE